MNYQPTAADTATRLERLLVALRDALDAEATS